MQYKTAIDTIGIQVDFNSSNEQNSALSELLDFLRNTKSYFLQNNSVPINASVTYVDHAILANNTVIAKIRTGFSQTVQGGVVVPIYYINITFAGLKRYNDLADKTSNDCLLKICAYCNTRGIRFKLAELDVCIDVDCTFENLMAFCVKKSPKTKYYSLQDHQAYMETQYIEKISTEKVSSSVLRAYCYDKRFKDELSINISRFELKLQNKYFNKYGVSIESIQKALNRYYVMYFENVYDKYWMMDIYHTQQFVRTKEAQRLGFERYRLYPDLGFVKNFLDQMFTVRMPLSNDIFFKHW